MVWTTANRCPQLADVHGLVLPNKKLESRQNTGDEIPIDASLQNQHKLFTRFYLIIYSIQSDMEEGST